MKTTEQNAGAAETSATPFTSYGLPARIDGLGTIVGQLAAQPVTIHLGPITIASDGVTYKGETVKDAGAVHAALLAVLNGRPLAPPAPAGATGLDGEMLATVLWLYRRLHRCYGRPPTVERPIKALAALVGIDVADCLAERGPDPDEGGAR